MFGIEEHHTFADNTFIPRLNKSLPALVEDMEKSLSIIDKVDKILVEKCTMEKEKYVFFTLKNVYK
jgi:hypothetical protein